MTEWPDCLSNHVSTITDSLLHPETISLLTVHWPFTFTTPMISLKKKPFDFCVSQNIETGKKQLRNN